MSKPAKLALLVVTLLPDIYMAAFLAVIVRAFRSHRDPFFSHPAWFFGIHFGMMVLMFALAALYLVMIIKTPRLRSEMKAVWAIAIFMAGPVGMPLFWYFQVWRDAAPSHVALELTSDEALALSNFLSRSDENADHAVLQNVRAELDRRVRDRSA